MRTIGWSAAILLALASPASAFFHLWQIGEVYSDASGDIQFIELANISDGENFATGSQLNSNGNTFTFPSDLPSFLTANRRMLVATPGYIALSGVPTADYNLGVNDFFSISGDTIVFPAGGDTFTFTAGQLPTNGAGSLNRAYGSSTITTALNSPTNFAGQTGTVPEPTATGLILALVPTVLRCRRRAS